MKMWKISNHSNNEAESIQDRSRDFYPHSNYDWTAGILQTVSANTERSVSLSETQINLNGEDLLDKKSSFACFPSKMKTSAERIKICISYFCKAPNIQNVQPELVLW